MSKHETYVGMDVAQDHLDVQVSGEPAPWRVPRTEAGLEILCTRLAPVRPARIVMEVTGGLELPVAQALSAAGHAVARVNPRQVRDFGRALGYRAKTDAIDAVLLARFAEKIQPAVRPLPDAETQALRSLVGRRRQVVRLIAQERTHRHTAAPDMQDRIDRHLAWLAEERDQLDQAIARRRNLQAFPTATRSAGADAETRGADRTAGPHGRRRVHRTDDPLPLCPGS